MKGLGSSTVILSQLKFLEGSCLNLIVVGKIECLPKNLHIFQGRLLRNPHDPHALQGFLGPTVLRNSHYIFSGLQPRRSHLMVVKIMVPFWIPIIIRHLIFRVPKTGS